MGGLMSEIERQGNQAIVRPGKDVVASMAPEFRTELLSLVEGGAKKLVVDLAGVEMIDSAGMGILINAHDLLSKASGDLMVTNASKDICALFKAMQLDQHFTVVAA